MYEVPDTQEPLGQDEGIEAPTKQVHSRANGKTDAKKQAALLNRVKTAKANIQTANLEEAEAFAEVASTEFISLASKATAIKIVEKTASCIRNAGGLATHFLKSTPTTGMHLEDALTSTIDMEDPFLMLIGS